MTPTRSPYTASLEAEIERLREALEEALALADEGWAYADTYFHQKWDYQGQRARLAALLRP